MSDDADVPEEEECVEEEPGEVSGFFVSWGAEKIAFGGLKVQGHIQEHEEPAGDCGPGESLECIHGN